jgi:peptidoglycan/LPS O-acetylase OafA/YrhL
MEGERPALAPLTSLRGIAAYSVLIGHAWDTSFDYGGHIIFEMPMMRLAYFGMSLFFVLSGFVIQYNYGPAFASERFGRAARRFYVARFARLYPLYLVTLLIGFLGFQYIPRPHLENHEFGLLSYLTLTQSWFNMEMAVFPPDWSISTEWFFYLTFLLLVWPLNRVRRPMRALVIFVLVTVSTLALSLHFWAPAIVTALTPFFWHGAPLSAQVEVWLVYFSPYVRIWEFIAGALAALAFSKSKLLNEPRSGVRVLTVLAIGWCLIVVATPLSKKPFLSDILSNVIFVPALLVILMSACVYKDWLAKLLSHPIMLASGEISYSVYIWCWGVISSFGTLNASAAPSPLAYLLSSVKFVAILLVTTMAASASYRYIEVPSRRWLRDRLGPRGLPTSRSPFQRSLG